MQPKDTSGRKRELAEKLMLARKIPGLTMPERREICFFLTGEQQPASKRGPKSQIDRDEVTAFINAIHRLDSGVDNLELADPAVGSKRGKQKLLQRGRESIVKWSSDVLNELTDNQDGIQKLQQQCTPPGTGMIYSEYFELLQEIAHIQKNNKKSQALCSELIRLMNTHKK